MTDYFINHRFENNKDDEPELLFTARRNYTLNGLFKSFVIHKEWNALEKEYNRHMSHHIPFNYEQNYSNAQQLMFTMCYDQDNPIIRFTNLSIAATGPQNTKSVPIFEVSSVFNRKTSSNSQDCTMRVNHKYMDQAAIIATSFQENENVIIKSYGMMLEYLIKYSKNNPRKKQGYAA